MTRTTATPLAAPSPGAGLSPAAAQVLPALAQELTEFQQVLQQLAQLAGSKITALRAADTPALEACAAREEQLLREVFRREQQRKAVLARTAQALHVATDHGVTLGDLAAALPEPLASSLWARSAGLQAAAEELQRKNQLVALVAQKLQSHIRGIFAEVAGVTTATPLYGPAGQRDARATRTWVDAVG